MTVADSTRREAHRQPHQEVSRETPWPAIGLLITIGVITAAQLGKIPPIAGTLGQDLGLSLVTIGWAMSVITLVSVLFGLSAGSLLGRIPMKRGLLGALALGAVASLAGAWVSGGPGLLAVRTGEGVAYLIITVACPALIAFNASGRDRALALALWGCFVAVGLALMNQLAPAIVAVGSWRWVFLAGAGMQALAFLALLAVRVDEPERTRSAAPARLLAEHRIAFGNRAAVGVATAFFCFAFLHVGFLSFLPLFLSESTSLGGSAAGSVAAAAALAYIPGALIAAVAMRRINWGIGAAIAGFAIMAASAAVIFTAAAPISAIIVGSLLLGVAGGVCGSVCFALVPLTTPAADQLRLATGMLAQFGSLAVLTSPPLIAALVDRGAGSNDWFATIPVYVAGSLVAIGLLWYLRKRIAL